MKEPEKPTSGGEIKKSEGISAYQTLQAMRISSCYGDLEKSINYREATEKIKERLDPENIEKDSEVDAE